MGIEFRPSGAPPPPALDPWAANSRRWNGGEGRGATTVKGDSS